MDNQTALVSCFARGWHAERNNVCVFRDDMAMRLLGEDREQIASGFALGKEFFLPGFTGSPDQALDRIVSGFLAPAVLGRSAFCEAALSVEKTLGASQYLLFGAGLDTYALRCPDSALKVYELDLPRMLNEKSRRIASAGLESSAVPIPCDLADDTWVHSLVSAGYDPLRRTFAGLLGLSYYLEKDSFSSLIAQIGQIVPPGSAVCFDYPAENDEASDQLRARLAAGAGESMKAVYSGCEIEMILSAGGFFCYEHADAKAVTQRFFADYNRARPDLPMRMPLGVACCLAVKRR